MELNRVKRKKHTNTNKQKVICSTMNSSWKSLSSLVFGDFLNAGTIFKVTKLTFEMFRLGKWAINLLFHWIKVEEHTIFFTLFDDRSVQHLTLTFLKRNKHLVFFLLFIRRYQRKKYFVQALKLEEQRQCWCSLTLSFQE